MLQRKYSHNTIASTATATRRVARKNQLWVTSLMERPTFRWSYDTGSPNITTHEHSRTHVCDVVWNCVCVFTFEIGCFTGMTKIWKRGWWSAAAAAGGDGWQHLSHPCTCTYHHMTCDDEVWWLACYFIHNHLLVGESHSFSLISSRMLSLVLL